MKKISKSQKVFFTIVLVVLAGVVLYGSKILVIPRQIQDIDKIEAWRLIGAFTIWFGLVMGLTIHWKNY